MNVLFLTLSDFVSLEKKDIYTDLISEFLEHGHYVYVLSPFEKKNSGNSEVITQGHLTIVRTQIGNYQKTNLFEKALTLLSMGKKMLDSMKINLHNVSFDIVLSATPPLSFYRMISHIKTEHNVLSYLMLKDIFPQNAVDLGIIKNIFPFSLLLRYYKNIENKLLQISDVIGCMSQKNVEYVQDNYRFTHPKIIEILPNAIKLQNDYSVCISKEIENIILSNKNKGKKILIYGGNLGRPQGVDFLNEFLNTNSNNAKVFIIIVGSGTEAKKVKNNIEKNKINNVLYLPQISKNEYEGVVNLSDIGLVFLDYRFTIPNFPSRILDYMKFSKPILAATDRTTDLGDIITDNGFGLSCYSNNIQIMNHKLEVMLNSDLNMMGSLGRKYLENNYTTENSYKIIMNHFRNGERYEK